MYVPYVFGVHRPNLSGWWVRFRLPAADRPICLVDVTAEGFGLGQNINRKQTAHVLWEPENSEISARTGTVLLRVSPSRMAFFLHTHLIYTKAT